MLEGLNYFFTALSEFATLRVIFDVLWATQLGIIVGMLPGLTATMGIALMTTLTFKLPPNNAVLILVCMYIGAIYGGGRSAILLNIPGTPANAATAVDGNPLARKGMAGPAIGIATTGSFLGSIIGMLLLATVTPVLGNFALRFHSYEFFWLAVFGVVISGNLTAPKDPLKGWIAGFFGLFVAMVGMEQIHAVVRFSFGNVQLSGGIGLIPAMVGAFGFSEIITMMKYTRVDVVDAEIRRVFPKVRDVVRHWKTIVRSGVIGTFIGAVPGVGEDIGAWVSYDFARRASKHPEEYGQGSYEGMISAEIGNNSAVAGAMIPVLSLAIPGSAPAAVLLAAMFIHGVRPGPLIMTENPQFVFTVVAMVFMATCAMFILGMSMVRQLVKVLQVPRQKLMPIIFVLCVIGAYAVQQRPFDIGVMAFFGLLGYAMKEMDYPVAPMVLGIILGDILDPNLRRALVQQDGLSWEFVTRPISAVLVAFIIITMVSRSKWFIALRQRLYGRLRSFWRQENNNA
jgi:putative tricarboxylic transport membrane protein